jgi:hypothetical protein
MTTFAALPDARELEALIRAAWTTYSDELRELDGQAYADTEVVAWERLQVALRELKGARPGRSGAR